MSRLRMHPERGLYAIADAGTVPAERLPALSDRVLAGGAVMLQYRDKISQPSVRERCALALRDACRRWRVPFLVNDDPALAARVRADGVHLGRADPGLAEARALLGAGAIIGISCYDSLERARQAQAAGADYVAFGSCHPSGTKPGAVRATPALLRRSRRTLAIPIAAIGGIAAENAAGLLRAGAGLLAVVRDLYLAADPEARARQYRRLFPSGPRDGRPLPAAPPVSSPAAPPVSS